MPADELDDTIETTETGPAPAETPGKGADRPSSEEAEKETPERRSGLLDDDDSPRPKGQATEESDEEGTPAEAPDPFSAILDEHGVADKFRAHAKDPAALVRELAKSYRSAQELIGQNSPYVNIGRMAAQDPDTLREFGEWMKGRLSGGGQPKSEPVIAFQYPHEIADFDRKVAAFQAHAAYAVQNGVNNQADLLAFVASNTGMPAQEVQAIQANLAYEEQAWSRWRRNPYSFAVEIVAPMLMPQFNQMLDQLRGQLHASAWWSKNQAELGPYAHEMLELKRRGYPDEAVAEIVRLRHGLSKNGQTEKKPEKKPETSTRPSVAGSGGSRQPVKVTAAVTDELAKKHKGNAVAIARELAELTGYQGE